MARYIKWLISVFFISVFLLGCDLDKNCKRINVPKQWKQWLNAYDLNDTVVFRGDRGNVDTFICIEKSSKYSACNKFELGEFQYETCLVKLKPKNCHGNDSNHCSMSLKFFMDFDYKDKGMISVYDLYDLRNTDKVIYEELELENGKKYRTRFVEFGKSGKSYNRKYIQSFNWNKEIGLIKYESIDGEVFTR